MLTEDIDSDWTNSLAAADESDLECYLYIVKEQE